MKTLNDNPSSGNPLPADKEFYEQDFNTTLEAEVFDNGPESPDESIEKEALEVIHDDYGNNPGRAQKLGADYQLVQARVNQLLHS